MTEDNKDIVSEVSTMLSEGCLPGTKIDYSQNVSHRSKGNLPNSVSTIIYTNGFRFDVSGDDDTEETSLSHLPDISLRVEAEKYIQTSDHSFELARNSTKNETVYNALGSGDRMFSISPKITFLDLLQNIDSDRFYPFRPLFKEEEPPCFKVGSILRISLRVNGQFVEGHIHGIPNGALVLVKSVLVKFFEELKNYDSLREEFSYQNAKGERLLIDQGMQSMSYNAKLRKASRELFSAVEDILKINGMSVTRSADGVKGFLSRSISKLATSELESIFSIIKDLGIEIRSRI